MQKEEKNKKIIRKYSPEFKLSAILDKKMNNLGYRETVRIHWQTTSRQQEELYVKTLRTWERIYLEEGEFGLMKEYKGKDTKLKDKNKGKVQKLERTVEKDLIAENQRLKMEIEYIKKLSALVLAEEQKNDKKR